MRQTLILCAALLAHPVVQAHGEKTHAPKATVIKEQKAWGIAGDAKAASRTVEFRMSDAMRFSPDRIELREGETVRFVLRNDGKLLHEFVIGSKAENDAHAALMMKFPDMEHDEPYMAHVPPGKTGQIVWTFNRAGEFDFACLIAGHYQAGMVGRIVVAPATKRSY
ncbi:MAG TPA: cupredoxin family protein [Methylibium sp.]|nr:cupredoxin family protein [Methylibium sp.]